MFTAFFSDTAQSTTRFSIRFSCAGSWKHTQHATAPQIENTARTLNTPTTTRITPPIYTSFVTVFEQPRFEHRRSRRQPREKKICTRICKRAKPRQSCKSNPGPRLMPTQRSLSLYTHLNSSDNDGNVRDN